MHFLVTIDLYMFLKIFLQSCFFLNKLEHTVQNQNKQQTCFFFFFLLLHSSARLHKQIIHETVQDRCEAEMMWNDYFPQLKSVETTKEPKVNSSTGVWKNNTNKERRQTEKKT